MEIAVALAVIALCVILGMLLGVILEVPTAAHALPDSPLQFVLGTFEEFIADLSEHLRVLFR